jgi:hypothetical protein
MRKPVEFVNKQKEPGAFHIMGWYLELFSGNLFKIKQPTFLSECRLPEYSTELIIHFPEHVQSMLKNSPCAGCL